MSERKARVSETPATQFLRRNEVAFGEHVYDYVDHGGTAESSRQLGVPEHHVVKTLVMQDDAAKPLVVLMHGDRKVSTKNLARQAGRKRIEPCTPEVAQRHTGYQVGGTSPFGLKKPLPIFATLTLTQGALKSAMRSRAMRSAKVSTSRKCPLPARARMRSPTCS